MKKLVHVNTLASAVGVALMGIGLSSSVTAAQPSLVAEVSTTAEVSSIGQYIITFAEPGLLHYEGGARNGSQELSATAPQKIGARKLDAQSPAARAYTSYLDAQRATHVTTIENRLGRPLDITHSYGVIRNGIAASLSPDELAAVAATPGVVSVKPVKLYTPDTFRGPKFIGANTIWDGSNVPGGAPSMGKGVKVGIIDMGANSQHPSFANDETCGFNATDKKFYAFDCNTSSAGHCTGTNPEAPVGADEGFSHGVHTASTAAGNTLDNTATPAPDLPNGVTMSGVAPCATVYSYRVSNAAGSLPSSAITASIEAIVTDGMDVANFSIGPTCGGGSPWGDDDRDFLDAIHADVFVAASAGNTRTNCPNPVGRVSHVGPWMLTVAASTQDQTLGQGAFEVTGPGTVPALLQNFGGTKGSTTEMDQVNDLTGYPFRTYPTNIAGCNETGGFPANYFQGAIAVIRRGATPPATTACNFSEKINNAANAGAVMVVIANNKNDAQGMDTTGATLPSFKINDLATSDALIAFVNANNGTPADPDVIFANGFEDVVADGATGDFVKGTSLVTVQGDVLGSFSFRGPTSGTAVDVTKPDITAPGVNIYAAGRAADNNYLFMSGTSMASPHVAGAATLIREIHPDWTVAEVKSALMTTSFQTGFQEDSTTPWTPDQVGSGRVDLTKAAKAGLTLDETYERFVAANPSGGTVAVKDLNIPSMRNSNCQTTCTWTRTVKNQLATSGSWNATATGNGFGLTVSPSSFTLAPGQTQELTVTATPTGTLSSIAFGQVDLVEASGQSPDQHITAAVKGGGGGGTGVGVECANGDCTFQIDVLGTQFSAIGCQTAYCGMLWVNQYTPDPADYPITITSVSTIFATGNGSNAAGDKINVYVYQDNDADPTNGATLAGSRIGYVMGAPVNSFVTIALTTPIVVNGPGHVLIALTNPAGNTGFNPASADTGPFAQRSWFAAYNDTAAGTNPNLASVGLEPNPDAIAGFNGNWLIRATGTNGSGRPVVLEPRSGRDSN